MKLNSLRYIAFMKLCANHRNSRDEGLGYHRGNDWKCLTDGKNLVDFIDFDELPSGHHFFH